MTVKERVILAGDPRTLSWEKRMVPLTAVATLPEKEVWLPVVLAEIVIELASLP